jgi:formyltetrahydrofolate synthetase
VIKKAYDDMKDNPTVEKIQALGERIAPDVRKAFGQKLQTKANLVVNPLIQPPPVGSGKKYSGKGFSDATQKFDDDFAKNLVKELM